MKFAATPLTMKAAYFAASYENTTRAGFGTDYDVRKTIEVEGESAAWAAEQVWMAYQNIDEERRTPDRKRSMMVGDLVQLIDDRGEETLWIVSGLGFKRAEFAAKETAQ